MDELEEMISEDITLDSRVHARIIGARGKGIRKIMDEFKVRLLRGQDGFYPAGAVCFGGGGLGLYILL